MDKEKTEKDNLSPPTPPNLIERKAYLLKDGEIEQIDNGRHKMQMRAKGELIQAI
jgi:hypothetical protein